MYTQKGYRVSQGHEIIFKSTNCGERGIYMFTTPIARNPLKTYKELLKFSYRTSYTAEPMTKSQNNGQIAYADENGSVYVTPFRFGINEILSEAGYQQGSLYVPFSHGEIRPTNYSCLVKIADEENLAKIHEDAFREATKKGIKPVTIKQKVWVKEISCYKDNDSHNIYTALAMIFPSNNSIQNIGTYIVVDEKTLVICDEYARTFLVKSKTVINDIVNALIDAGYSRTAHPEWYIRHYEPKEEMEAETE